MGHEVGDITHLVHTIKISRIRISLAHLLWQCVSPFCLFRARLMERSDLAAVKVRVPIRIDGGSLSNPISSAMALLSL